MKARDYPFPTVEIACDHCGRFGRYRKERFVEIVGADTDLPQALTIIAAGCPEDRPSPDNLHGNCKPHYAQSLWGAAKQSDRR